MSLDRHCDHTYVPHGWPWLFWYVHIYITGSTEVADHRNHCWCIVSFVFALPPSYPFFGFGSLTLAICLLGSVSLTDTLNQMDGPNRWMMEYFDYSDLWGMFSNPLLILVMIVSENKILGICFSSLSGCLVMLIYLWRLLRSPAGNCWLTPFCYF
jgi:ABC-type branched-subunit amino acid transport system permease subunit